MKISKMSTNIKIDDGFIVNSEKQLKVINSDYVELLLKARRMNFDNNRILSRALGSPQRIKSFLPKKSILIILMSIITGGFFTALIVLFLPGKGSQDG